MALDRLGYKCVFACEIDHDLRHLYEKNFGIMPHGDIRMLGTQDIPSHDILCAGFPCQPFSKAGGQDGLECPRWGDLIDYVVAILSHHKPMYFILENVPNLLKHDDGETWKAIENKLRCNGMYDVDGRTLSPHQFGIPQIRERLFIVGRKGSLNGFSWPKKKRIARQPNISKVLDRKPKSAKQLSEQVVKCLNVWQEFLELYPKNEPFPSFPIWSMEFGKRYAFAQRTPYAVEKAKLPKSKLRRKAALKRLSIPKRLRSLPAYARNRSDRFPSWKIEFIRKNRSVYRKHKKWIDKWLPKIRKFPPSLQKLEWNCNSGKRDIWKYLIQFRASGVRVKKRTSSPSLVAMTTTQVPIVAWERRYMTPRECARLQSLIGLRHLPRQYTKAIKALGNAVNAHLVESIACNLTRGWRDSQRAARKSKNLRRIAVRQPQLGIKPEELLAA